MKTRASASFYWDNLVFFGMGPKQGPDGIAGEHLTGAEMAAAMTQAFGRPVRYNAVTPEQYRGLGFPGADDLGNMFQFKRDFNEAFCAPRNPSVARSRTRRCRRSRSGWRRTNNAFLFRNEQKESQ